MGGATAAGLIPGGCQLRLPMNSRSTYQNIRAIDANSCMAADT